MAEQTEKIRLAAPVEVIRERLPFTIIENQAIDDERLTGKDINVYQALCRFANIDRECWPSYAAISKKARCDRSTSIRSIKKLIKLGYVEKLTRKDPAGDAAPNVFKILSLTTPVGGVVAGNHHLVAQEDHGSGRKPPRVVAGNHRELDLEELDPMNKGNARAGALPPSRTREEQEQAPMNLASELASKLKEINRALVMGKSDLTTVAILQGTYSDDRLVTAYRNHQRKRPGQGFNLFVRDLGQYMPTEPQPQKPPMKREYCLQCKAELRPGGEGYFACAVCRAADKKIWWYRLDETGKLVEVAEAPERKDWEEARKEIGMPALEEAPRKAPEALKVAEHATSPPEQLEIF